VGTVLVDGRVVAGWSFKADRIVVDPFESIPTRDARAIERERRAIEAFHTGTGASAKPRDRYDPEP
jgi:hypothetical protein